MAFPGWDNLDAVSRIHRFFEIGGIAVLLLLVVFEAIAYTYGHRKELLTETAREGESKVLKVTQEELRTLEAMQKPRRLTDEQMSRLKTELSPFSKQRVNIAAHSGDHESLNFAFDIQKGLMAADWQAAGVGNSGFHAKPGIWIWYQPVKCGDCGQTPYCPSAGVWIPD